MSTIWGHPANFGFASSVSILSCYGMDTWIKAIATTVL